MAEASPNLAWDLWRASFGAAPCDCSCSAAVARWSVISAWISAAMGSSPGGLDMLNPQDQVHRTGEFGPFLAKGQTLLAAEGGELIVLALAAFGRLGPFGFEQAALFEAMEGRIERAFLGQKLPAAGFLDRTGNLVAVGRAVGDDFENDGLKCSAEQIGTGFHGLYLVWQGIVALAGKVCQGAMPGDVLIRNASQGAARN